MKFFFHERAEAELDNAAAYYESRQQGLGLDFLREVYAAVSLLTQHPLAWSPISKNTRKCLVPRFPYGIIYQVKADHVRIIAVADLRRRPGYWRGRRWGLGQGAAKTREASARWRRKRRVSKRQSKER